MSDPSNTKMDRREFLKKAGIAGLVLVGTACTPAAAPPTTTPTPKLGVVPTAAALKPEQFRAQLYEAARKEGQVLFYGPPPARDMDDYRKSFYKSYPGIEVKDFAGPGEEVLQKMLTEFKAGKVNVDCFLVPLEQWVVVHKEGLAEKWDPPEKVNFPPDAIDPKGFYVVDHAVIHVIFYNTQRVPVAEAPKNYQDLLKPIFKGKLALEREAYSWFTQRMKIWGKDKAIDYARSLAVQQPMFLKGHSTLADAVVKGEVWAAVNVYQSTAEQAKAKGAPVRWVVDEPTGAEPLGLALAKGAQHPNAGKLFIDWRLSQEGQAITLDPVQKYPFRQGVVIPSELRVKVVLPNVETAAETPQNARLFKEIFGLV